MVFPALPTLLASAMLRLKHGRTFLNTVVAARQVSSAKESRRSHTPFACVVLHSGAVFFWQLQIVIYAITCRNTINCPYAINHSYITCRYTINHIFCCFFIYPWLFVKSSYYGAVSFISFKLPCEFDYQLLRLIDVKDATTYMSFGSNEGWPTVFQVVDTHCGVCGIPLVIPRHILEQEVPLSYTPI